MCQVRVFSTCSVQAAALQGNIIRDNIDTQNFENWKLKMFIPFAPLP